MSYWVGTLQVMSYKYKIVRKCIYSQYCHKKWKSHKILQVLYFSSIWGFLWTLFGGIWVINFGKFFLRFTQTGNMANCCEILLTSKLRRHAWVSSGKSDRKTCFLKKHQQETVLISRWSARQLWTRETINFKLNWF